MQPKVDKLQTLKALKDAPIGIFDSGLGGLTVLRELRKVLPNEKYIYLGDTARTPYGSKSSATVLRYAAECANYLLEQRIKLLVVACNTASAIALRVLDEECICPVIGTIDGTVSRALKYSISETIGVIGTTATISSGVYQREIEKNAPKANVYSAACPLFVPLVEQGMLSGEIVSKIVEHHLKELKASDIDTLILGCTHYPLLLGALNEYFGANVELIECSKSIALDVFKLLKQADALNPSAIGDERYFVTDDVSRFNTFASLFLDTSSVDAVHVEELPSEGLRSI
ncbi:MAG: glutamate racemase [Bdellovibrionales bacterium]|nr:glutamate racemase [Bdellovibrionales bacterium]